MSKLLDTVGLGEDETPTSGCEATSEAEGTIDGKADCPGAACGGFAAPGSGDGSKLTASDGDGFTMSARALGKGLALIAGEAEGSSGRSGRAWPRQNLKV